MKNEFDLVLLKQERKFWRTVELSELTNEFRTLYSRRKQAVDMYIDGYTVKQIMEATGLKGKSEAKRLLIKCITPDENGTSKGYASLIPYKHISDKNTRKKPQTVFDSARSNTGMFRLLLDQNPELKVYIDNLYFGKNKSVLEKNISVTELHRKFLDKCKQLGIKEYEYPFNVASKGLRSLYKYIKELRETSPQKLRPRLSNDAYEKMSSTGIGEVLVLSDVRPFSVVQLDGHKLDCLTTIEITTPKGDKERKTIQRFWLLTLIDVATRTILGYHLTVKAAYDRFDVLKCIENAVRPKSLQSLTIPGLEYPENTGYHSIAIPESEWAVFDEIMLDNALAHLSHDVLDRITSYLHATVNFGPVASPERRGIVERFYQTIESRGYHRLASTTGTGITDTRRRNAEKDAVKYGINFTHIEELTEMLIAQYNNTPHNANNGFTPLEVMKQRMDKGLLPNYIEAENRSNFMLNYITVTRTVCGKIGTGRRPYVTFEGAEYRSDVLSKSFELVGKKLILRFNSDDIRTCKSFFEDGSEFCELCVVGHWRNEPHSLEQRKSINKLLYDKKLKGNSFIDPVKVYDEYLINESQNTKRARNKLAARQLAQSAAKQQNDNINITKKKESKQLTEKHAVLSNDELEERFMNQKNKIRYN